MDEVVSIYIMHGVTAQQNNFDSIFKSNIQFVKTYKIFLRISWINISAVTHLGDGTLRFKEISCFWQATNCPCEHDLWLADCYWVQHSAGWVHYTLQ